MVLLNSSQVCVGGCSVLKLCKDFPFVNPTTLRVDSQLAAVALGGLTELFPVNWFKISVSAGGLSSFLTEF